MLKIEHFSKTYPGGNRAVDDLSLHVAPGEIFGFIGHNGAGKTTTLRAVSGVMDFTEGTITIDGHNVRTDALAAKKVTAFLPDNPDLYDFLTGIQFLNFNRPYPIFCSVNHRKRRHITGPPQNRQETSVSVHA